MNIFIIKRLLASVARFGNSHGFGVQSPFAYHFIKNVARERLPYYAYDTLLKKYPENVVQGLALHRFLLRFSNFMQKKPWVMVRADNVDEAYIKAGCKETKFRIIDNPAAGGCDAIVFKDMAEFNAYRLRHENCIAFDLYDCGVIIFDQSKQNGYYKLMLKP